MRSCGGISERTPELKTRMSIGLPPAPAGFVENALDVVNAMRTIRHHASNGTGTVEAVGGVVVQRTVQGKATFLRDDRGLTVAYEPEHGVAQGFEPVVFRFGRHAYPQSPLWTVPGDGLVGTFADLSTPLLQDAKMVGYRIGDAQDQCIAVLEADADEGTLEIEGLVEDLSNGTDVAAGGAWTIRRRWTAFGTPPLAEPVGEGGVVYRVPADDEPNPGRRQAGFRIRMLERFMTRLPPAIVIVRMPDGTYDTMPHSLTRRPPAPEDADGVRSRAVQAFHRLSVIETAGDA
jgi:hypothetical protein